VLVDDDRVDQVQAVLTMELRVPSLYGLDSVVFFFQKKKKLFPINGNRVALGWSWVPIKGLLVDTSVPDVRVGRHAAENQTVVIVVRKNLVDETFDYLIIYFFIYDSPKVAKYTGETR